MTSACRSIPGFGVATRYGQGVYFTAYAKGGGAMTATVGTAEGEELHDLEQLSDKLAEYSLTTSSGTADLAESTWSILLSTDGRRIRRDVWRGPKPWKAAAEGWEPEGIIWPTWPVRPAREMSAEEAALNGVEVLAQVREPAAGLGQVDGYRTRCRPGHLGRHFSAGTDPAAPRHGPGCSPAGWPGAAVRHAVPYRPGHAPASGVLQRGPAGAPT
jgi:hypothetical protein